MSADAKPGDTEIAAAMREMIDGFRDAGVLLDSTVGRTKELQLSPPHEPDLERGRPMEYMSEEVNESHGKADNRTC